MTWETSGVPDTTSQTGRQMKWESRLRLVSCETSGSPDTRKNGKPQLRDSQRAGHHQPILGMQHLACPIFFTLSPIPIVQGAHVPWDPASEQPGIVVSNDLSTLAPRVQGCLNNVNMDLAMMNSILLEQKVSGVWSSWFQVLIVAPKIVKVCI